MVEIADVEDQESLEAYLNGLPAEWSKPVATAIATRTAIRSAPTWALYFDSKSSNVVAPSNALVLFRCTLTSSVALFSPTDDVENAARAAADATSNATRAATACAAAIYAASRAATDTTRATTTFSAAATRAATAFAAAAYAATNATSEAAYTTYSGATAQFWTSLRNDLAALASGMDVIDLFATPLWAGVQIEPDVKEWKWSSLLNHLAADKADWSFWISFSQAMLRGAPQNWKMLEEIAISPDIDWTLEPVAVNAKINEIVARYDHKPSAQVIEKVRNALDANRPSIEAQIASLRAMIAEEVERIRGTNPKDDIEAAEKERRLEFFSGLLAIVAALDAALPAGPEATDKEAEVAAGLLATFGAHFKNWPRENAKELVDSTYRVAIVGVCAGAGALFGLPAIGAAIGAAMFGGKKIGDAIGQAMKNPAQ